MEITYNKQYRSKEYKYFTLYDNVSFNSTKVFLEYYGLIKMISNLEFEELKTVLKNYKKRSKSNLNISYSEDRIEFFKPNKQIFPEFYVIKK